MEGNSGIHSFDDLIIRYRDPRLVDDHNTIILIHGWTGDENSMWIFADRLPSNALILAPRGLYRTPLGGFGWHKINKNGWPHVDDFFPAIESLDRLISSGRFGIKTSNLSLVGFSQGAALAFIYALHEPKKVSRIAGLSGFLPMGVESLVDNQRLKEMPVFIAHGEYDKLVPVKMARDAVKLLEVAGAQVTYCEDTVGHKLSLNCYRGLEKFFTP